MKRYSVLWLIVFLCLSLTSCREQTPKKLKESHSNRKETTTQVKKIELEKKEEISNRYLPPEPPLISPVSINEKIADPVDEYEYPLYSTEQYSGVNENSFMSVKNKPFSTFSIDVDRASYANIRRFIRDRELPPNEAVRIEEMINYFDYNYDELTNQHPYSVHATLTESPWHKEFQLAHIALQAKKIKTSDLPASNLVFLIDVSGSMQSPDKLELLKAGFQLLVEELRPQDKISIVTYAGNAGLVLKPTSGENKQTILDAIRNLDSGGSTAGGEGILLAYKIAAQNFKKNGNNRVILATDGDFNVGVQSEQALEKLIEEKRQTGIYLSVLGFGTGNYQDGKMEILADKGNGNYAYIDQILEAKKVFVHEFGGTLFTVAKDVKLQVEFNPAFIQAYRLIGYENRSLNDEDFHDDKKDAGEMGSGHTVTAIYELIPNGVKTDFVKPIDDLKYQKVVSSPHSEHEYFTVKTRYKLPKETKSVLFNKAVYQTDFKTNENLGENQKFAIAVAEFGLLLKESKFKGSANFTHLKKWTKSAIKTDEEGYKAEFLQLVQSAELMQRTQAHKN